MAKQAKRKDGLIEKKITVDGKRITFYARSERELFQKIAAYSKKEETGMLFKEVAAEWWNCKEPLIAVSTAAGYKTAKNRCVERFGEEPIKDITPSMVRGWLDWLARKKYARKTVANHLIVISGIFSWACEYHDLPVNPATLVHVPDGLRKSKRHMPTPDQITIIQNNAQDKDGLFFYFLIYTGVRRGEALALQWKDVDVQHSMIHVTKSMFWGRKNNGEIKAPKTEAGTRAVIYLDRLKDILEPYRKSGEIYIFGDEQPITLKAYRWMLKRYQKKTGLAVTPHQLRHAFATLCFEANVPEKTAQGLLGHAQLSTTMDIYAELRGKKIAEAATALNSKDF